MTRYILAILVAMSLLGISPAAIAGDEKPWEMLLPPGQDGCTAIGDYYIPKKLLDTVKINSDDSFTTFTGQDIFKIMTAYNNEIRENLKEATNPRRNGALLLHCAEEYNRSQKALLDKWYTDTVLKMMEKGSSQLTELATVLHNANSTSICKHYNEIALAYERKGMVDEAENIYRTVLRNYPKIQGCFREAEIALQTLRAKVVK